MENVLDSIDDKRAVAILTRVAKGRGLLACAPGLEVRQAQAALAEAFGQAGSGDTPTEADLARQCLRLLSQNPDTAQAIAAMAGQPSNRTLSAFSRTDRAVCHQRHGVRHLRQTGFASRRFRRRWRRSQPSVPSDVWRPLLASRCAQ